MQKRELHSALGCNVYISEGRDKRLIEQLQAEAQANPGVALANVFVDEPYHRTGFTFVSDQPDKLTAAVVRLSRAALQLLDLRLHDATHPRLGIVDHISLHPLGSLVPRPAGHSGAPQPHPTPRLRPSSPSLSPSIPATGGSQPTATHGGEDEEHGSGGGRGMVWEAPPPGLRGLAVAASCAHDIAWCLSGVGDSETYDPDGLEAPPPPQAVAPPVGPSGQSGNKQQQQQPYNFEIPVYMYGFAHSSRRSLAVVRRELGYFKRSSDGGWHGELTHGSHLAEDLERFPPDLGPAEAPPRSGLVTIGAVPWVVNYNVPLVGVDLNTATAIARALSERGGGLAGVETVALTHSNDSVEVACNLLDAAATPPQLVQSRLEALAYTRGLAADQVRPGYRTNRSPEELLRAAVAQLEGGRRAR